MKELVEDWSGNDGGQSRNLITGFYYRDHKQESTENLKNRLKLEKKIKKDSEKWCY